MKQNIHVVIAEDDAQVAEIQRRFVERVLGYEVVGIAFSTIEAMELIEVLKPDLVLLDVYFSNNSGLELLRKIRLNNSRQDVVLITAAKEVEVLQAAIHLGVFDYILKPLVFARLQETLTVYRQRYQHLRSVNSLNQSMVDKLLGARVVSHAKPLLPKGIDNLTLDKIKRVFYDVEWDSSFSAEQVGKKVGMSRTTARRYLEFLVDDDFIRADISYGTVGRPERRYCPLRHLA